MKKKKKEEEEEQAANAVDKATKKEQQAREEAYEAWNNLQVAIRALLPTSLNHPFRLKKLRLAQVNASKKLDEAQAKLNKCIATKEFEMKRAKLSNDSNRRFRN